MRYSAAYLRPHLSSSLIREAINETTSMDGPFTYSCRAPRSFSIHCIIIVMFTRTLACISYSLGTSREKPSWPTGGLFLRSTRRVCTATAEYHPTPCRTTSGERSVSFDCKIKNKTVYISFDPSYGGTAIETTVKSGRHDMTRCAVPREVRRISFQS